MNSTSLEAAIKDLTDHAFAGHTAWIDSNRDLMLAWVRRKELDQAPVGSWVWASNGSELRETLEALIVGMLLELDPERHRAPETIARARAMGAAAARDLYSPTRNPN